MRAWAACWLALLAGAARARELDPAACSSRFDVQRDKIIRTEESRDMGARYLSELDVGARAECLRLCCETDACDVFVYEEKSPGSCYMFNCGPPEDFRCKFTAHSNFSSGVLALSRRLAELQDQERLAHHERELASLRSASSPPPPAASSAAPAAPPAAAPSPAASRCSRYQFACRRGGECIAVYNACDGVPQCADGSDEAPELGCPPPATRAPPPAPPPPAQMAEAASGEPLAESGAESSDRWPHRLAQAQPPHRYNDASRGSHIFSHKGGLLQDAEPPLAVQYPAFEPPWPRRTWGQAQTGGEWGGAGGGYARPEWAEPDPRRAWPVPPRQPPDMVYIPPKTMPEMPMMYSSQQQTLRDSPKKGLDLEKKPPEATPPPPAPAPAPAAPPAPPPPPPPPAPPAQRSGAALAENTTKKKDAARQPAPGVEAARAVHEPFVGDDHDGLSERPPAAVLLLVLGVAMTAAMAAMVGCRARAARRRLRRGKSPFAHDADYLVNGMYL